MKFTLLFVLYALFQIGAYCQIYYPGDIESLNAIKQSCDKNNTLNWRGDVPPQYWEGVTWQLDVDGVFYVVTKLDLSNKNISGNLVVKDLYYLTSLQCQNNLLKGLTIENCPSLNSLNCAANQLPISELLKFNYLGSSFTYNPQAAVFEEQTDMPGYVIDYSSQADGGNTKFVFRNRSKPGNDGSEIVTMNNTGICPITEDGVYFCEMVNPKLNHNNFYSHTANINTFPVIKMTTVLPVGSQLPLKIGTLHSKDTVKIDFGDGILHTYYMGVYVPGLYIGSEIKGIVGSSQTIKIYGKSITMLDCGGNKLTMLDIQKSPTLLYLWCINNQLTLLDLINNIQLIEIGCDYNLLTSLDVSRNTQLFDFSCVHNQLKLIDLRKNSELYDFNCSDNKLTELDVSANSKLRTIVFGYNDISVIDLTNNTKLQYIECWNTKLSKLDVSNNPDLFSIYCRGNYLKEINTDNNLALKELNCEENEILNLNLNNNRVLEELYCRFNQLTTLDVSKNNALTVLDCSNNQITSLDVTNNLALTTLWCSDNNLTFATLPPKQLTWKSYIYEQQKPFKLPKTITKGSIVDLSQQYSINGYITEYHWYTAEGSMLRVDEDYTIENGKTKFLKPQSDSVHCELYNNYFEHIRWPSLLSSTYIKVIEGGDFDENDLNTLYSHPANTIINIPGESSLKSITAVEALSSSSINKESSEIIKIYPNPVVDVINIELLNKNLPATITLYSIDGKQLKKVDATSAKTAIGMEDLKRGNYIIEIETAKEKIKKKVVKL